MELEYERYHKQLSNHDLVRIAHFERGKIKKEARRSAKKVLKQRNLPPNLLAELKNNNRKSKKAESKAKLNTKGNGYNIFNFIFDFIFFGFGL